MTKKEKWVAFREEQKLVNIIDNVVDSKGIDRSDFIREAIRKELASLSFLPEIQKKALGVKTNQKEESVCK